jgi:hypothetical protein
LGLSDVVNDLVSGIYQLEHAIGFTAEDTFNHTLGDALNENLDGSLQGIGAGSFRHLAEDLVHAASCATRVLVALIVMSIYSPTSHEMAPGKRQQYQRKKQHYELQNRILRRAIEQLERLLCSKELSLLIQIWHPGFHSLSWGKIESVQLR